MGETPRHTTRVSNFHVQLLRRYQDEGKGREREEKEGKLKHRGPGSGFGVYLESERATEGERKLRRKQPVKRERHEGPYAGC